MSFQLCEELEVWKKACRLAVKVYTELNDCRHFRLKDPMQPAAVSIASNFAEGHNRGRKDFARFVRIAHGSCAELRAQLSIVRKVDLLPETAFQELLSQSKETSRKLYGTPKTIIGKVEP